MICVTQGRTCLFECQNIFCTLALIYYSFMELHSFIHSLALTPCKMWYLKSKCKLIAIYTILSSTQAQTFWSCIINRIKNGCWRTPQGWSPAGLVLIADYLICNIYYYPYDIYILYVFLMKNILYLNLYFLFLTVHIHLTLFILFIHSFHHTTHDSLSFLRHSFAREHKHIPYFVGCLRAGCCQTNTKLPC